MELYHGDCLEILPTLPAQSIHAIITDLPYGTTQAEWDSIIPFEFMWKEVSRLLVSNGVFITTASQPFTSELINSNRDLFKYEIIWKKTRASGHLDARRKPMKIHENILIFSKGSTTYNPQLSKGKKYISKHGGGVQVICMDHQMHMFQKMMAFVFLYQSLNLQMNLIMFIQHKSQFLYMSI